MMRKLITICMVVVLALSGMVQGNVITLQFNANDIYNYATSDDTRINQQGTARYIWDSPTGRNYRTYNDATRDAGATAAKDLQSVENILEWTAFAGYQGASHLQLWLCNGRGADWGEMVVMKRYTTISASVNGEYDWTAYIGEHPWDTDGEGDGVYTPGDEYGLAHFNTVLGGEGHQNAISPDYNPADNIWSVTGDFYVDVDGDGTYNSAVDSDLVLGSQYTIWFNAALNNWHCVDDYGNDTWGSPDIQGTIIATAIPEPATVALLGLGALGLFRKRR